jgi:uncharacterized protein
MPHRELAPLGSPCWADLWTSDVEGSRSFYGEVFGWEAQEPSSEFGGYFMFTRDGIPVAGGMGDMGDMPAANTWKIYLNTNDVAATLQAATAGGAQIILPGMPIADLGSQAVLIDPTGAQLGTWQPDTFQGFSVLGEHGAPSWFELHTRDYATAVEFYRSTFQWDIGSSEDGAPIRYAVMRGPGGEDELAGIMDASSFLADGAPSHWAIYWEVEDPEASIGIVLKLGGSVVAALEETPYGRITTVTDPVRAEFRLRAQNR